MIHLAILREPYLTDLLEGRKTIETRWTLVQCVPYGIAEKGHQLWIKPPAKPIIVAKTTIIATEYFFHPFPEQNEDLISKYNNQMLLREEDKKAVCSKPYVSLIWVGKILQVSEPMPFKKSDRRGWMIVPSLNPKSRIDGYLK